MCPKWNILILKLMFVVVALCFYDNRDNRNNGLILNSMLSVDNNKNNFYQPKGWLPLDPTFTFIGLKAQRAHSPGLWSGCPFFNVVMR